MQILLYLHESLVLIERRFKKKMKNIFNQCLLSIKNTNKMKKKIKFAFRNENKMKDYLTF